MLQNKSGLVKKIHQRSIGVLETFQNANEMRLFPQATTIQTIDLHEQVNEGSWKGKQLIDGVG